MEPRRRFRFMKEISEGAFGKVYLAEMITGENFKSVVAIKLLHGKWTEHEEIVQRSRDEARVLGLLHHRNIIRVEDLTSINGQCAIIMEYLEGVDVKTLINHVAEQKQRFPRKVAFEITGQIGSALDAAYWRRPIQGGEPLRLIHRDIKPSNVMVTVAGDVKVLDFGTAQAHFDHREAHTQALAFGSAAYMAPERLLGDPDAPSGDIFSLGITLYEMLSGAGYGKIHIRPEKAERVLESKLNELDLSDLAPERSTQVRAALRLLLAYEAADRPNAGQVVELMDALAEEIHDSTMRRFCREIVQPCRNGIRPPQNPNDPLTGSTLFEDNSGLRETDSAEDSNTWISEHGEGASPFIVPPELEALPEEPRAAAAEAPAPAAAPPAVEESTGPVVLLDPPPVARVARFDPAPDEPEAPPPLSYQVEIADEDVTDPGVAATSGPQAAPPPATAPEAVAPPPAISGPRPVSERRPHPIAAAGKVAIEISEEDAADAVPPPKKGGGIFKVVVAGGLLLALLAVVGVGAVIVGGISLGGGSDDVAPVPGPEAPRTDKAVAGGVIKVGEPGGTAGTLKLSLQPAGQALVSISSSVGSFKQDWDGSGTMELVGLEAGTYRTKIAPRSGRPVRSTVDVKAGQSCSYTYTVGQGEEWQSVGCE